MTERFDGEANEYFIKLYWDDLKVQGELGNIFESDAYVYSGRGFTQLTGRLGYNYYDKFLGIDLLGDPNLTNDPQIAVQIILHGMVNGIYKSLSYTDDTNTVAQAGGGPKLSDFEFPDQFAEARSIVSSGDAEAIAAIANLYACVFETLCLAGALPEGIICASGDCQ